MCSGPCIHAQRRDTVRNRSRCRRRAARRIRAGSRWRPPLLASSWFTGPAELQARTRRVGSTRWPGRRRLSRLQGRTDHAGLVAQAQPHPGRRGRAAILPSAGRVGAYTFAHGVSCHGPSRPTTRTTLRPRDRGPEKPRRGRLPLGSPCGAGSRVGAGREARPRARAGLGALVVSRVEAEVGAAAPGDEQPHPRQESTPALRSDPRGLPASLPAGAWRAGRRLPRADRAGVRR